MKTKKVLFFHSDLQIYIANKQLVPKINCYCNYKPKIQERTLFLRFFNFTELLSFNISNGNVDCYLIL